jgi:four helix bundle protein
MGSASELEYHLLLARDLRYLSAETHAALDGMTVEIKRMLAAFLRTLKSSTAGGHKVADS